jgi:hypothetical protein
MYVWQVDMEGDTTTLSRLPVTFFVSTHRPGLGGGLGRLTVLPGAISLDGWPIVRCLLVHDRGSVAMIRARFAPPWWRTGFILRGDGRSYGFALTTTGAVSRLVVAIEQAGFEIHEQETRFSRFPWASFRG